MATQTIKCRRCGFEATYVEIGSKGKLQENTTKKARICAVAESYKEAKDCPEFALALKTQLGVSI